jgi:hypothetical protein
MQGSKKQQGMLLGSTGQNGSVRQSDQDLSKLGERHQPTGLRCSANPKQSRSEELHYYHSRWVIVKLLKSVDKQETSN